jgi:hypothetical protein
VRLESRPTGLAAEDRQFVPEHEDLEFLRTVAPSEQHKKREQTAGYEVERPRKQWRLQRRESRRYRPRRQAGSDNPDRVSAL